MARRLLRASLLLGLLLGCSDQGPQVPLLFVKPPTSSNGAGTITSSPGGISCTISNQTFVGNCSANFESGAAVTLTATPAAGSTFAGWGGECAGTDATCAVTLDANADVTAAFTLDNPRRLTVSATGTGSGNITSLPGGLNCVYDGDQTSGTCEADFADGAVVTVTAAAAVGTGFNAWSDDCASAGGTATCQVTMSADRSASAEFVSVSFGGFMASTDDATTGLVVVNIPVASAKVAAALPPGISLATTANGVIAIGTMTYLGSAPFTVAGVYDTAQKSLSLTSGDGFQMDASFDGTVFDGSFADPTRDAFGIATLTAASAGSPPAAFCGSYTTDVNSPLADNGSWNIVVSGDTLVTGVTASAGIEGAFTLSGTLRSGTVTLTVGDGTATGTTDGTTFTGTWNRNDLQFIGTWTASSANCQ